MPNRLADETSPYLRQHADNPVDWHPWGDEAFARARAEDKPVLLSVGYSSCHWCHVMAHESFEHDGVADVMNDRFVNVKVDREERPDVDAIYMEAVQAMTGRGGWPMTVFLMPDGRPFFGGTYFPRERRGQMIGFVELLERIDDVWRTRRGDIDEQANQLTEAITRTARLEAPPGATRSADILTTALDGLAGEFDRRWGGFGGAPKFPQAMSLELVLRAHDHLDGPAAPALPPERRGADRPPERRGADRPPERRGADRLAIVTGSLDAMAAGGIYDHLGGGFARYSTDERWLVPHFEKMLYDQALLARLYLHAWQVTGAGRYRQVLDETIGYVLRDLRHPGGGFYAAEDADSLDEHGHSVEGEFYVWTPAQIRAAIGDPDLATAAIEWWGVTDDGNFEGRSILSRPLGADLAGPAAIERARRALFEARSRRPRPGLDDKVLAEWNGLMLATLAEAAAATGDATWLDAARRCGEFLLANLRRDDGRWLRTARPSGGERRDRPSGGERRDRPSGGERDGTAPPLAYATDHGALLDAFTRLYEATGEARWISEATAVADALVALFWDTGRGGVFTTGADAPSLVTRPKDLMDNATPSANSLAAMGLLRLAALTGEARHRDRAIEILDLLSPVAGRHPGAFAHLLGALDLETAGAVEIVVAGSGEDATELVRAVGRRYLPNAVLAWGEPFDSALWEGRAPAPGSPARAYVCRGSRCLAPVSDIEDLVAELESVEPAPR